MMCCVFLLARVRHVGIEMPRVGPPIIRMVVGDPKGLQQSFALQNHPVLMPHKDLRQDLPCAMILLASADQHRTIPGSGGTSMHDASWRRRQAATAAYPLPRCCGIRGSVSDPLDGSV